MTISLAAQIEELDYEIAMRRDVYGRLDRTKPKGHALRAEHMRRMEAAKATLERLREVERISNSDLTAVLAKTFNGGQPPSQ